MTRPTLQIVVASTRPNRIGLRIAQWFEQRALDHGGFEVELVDLAEVNLPLFDEPNHPRLGRYEHEHTKAWSAIVDRADAFVFVMPEYNHGFNAALKNALDFVYREWNDKAAGFVSYGGVAGGTRAVAMLKPVLAALQVVPVVQSVTIPFAGAKVTDGSFDADEPLEAAAVAMLDALVRIDATLAPLRRPA